MCAQKMSWREIVALRPFVAIRPARLPAEESSLCRIDQKLIGVIALSGNIGIVAFVAQLRNQDAVGSSHIPILSVNLIPTLMEIGGGWLRRKGVQTHVLQLLGIDHERHCRRLLRT